MLRDELSVLAAFLAVAEERSSTRAAKRLAVSPSAPGRVRLLLPRTAATTVLAPKLGQFARNYTDVVLDVTTDNSRLDLVAAGFDAGIQLGEFIEQELRITVIQRK
jgi:DNA-binding transcriptional LysR family regulator